MIVTLKPCFTKFKACLFKKGGWGSEIGASGPGGEFTSRINTRAPDLCCISATLLVIVCFDLLYLGIKKGRYTRYRPSSLQLGENYSANPNLCNK